MEVSRKLSWQERVMAVDELHKTKLREHNLQWRISDTAKLLNRSYGSVAEDLMLASWMRTHPKIEKYKSIYEALEFIRAKKKEMRLA